MKKFQPRESSSSSKNVKSNTSQPPEKKTGNGLFGGLFGSKKANKSSIVVDEDVEVYEEEEPDISNQSITERKIVKRTIPVETNIVPSSQPVANTSAQEAKKRLYKDITQAPTRPVVKPIMSNTAAKETYDNKTMDHTVLLYCDVRYLVTIQKAFNLRTNIACAGISDPVALMGEYRKQPVFDYIIIYILEQSEVKPITDFLIGLNLPSLNPEILKILIIRDQDIDIASLRDNPQLKAIPRLSEYVRLIVNKEGMSEAFTEKVIAEIVSKQPAFPSIKTQIKPQNAEVFMNNGSTFKVDINRLNEHLIAARADDSQNAVILSQVKQRLVASNDSDLTRLLSEVSGDIPSLKLVKEVEAEVSAQIERLRKDPRAKAQIAELIKSKLLLSTLKTREFQTVIDQLLTNAQLNMQHKYDNLSTMTSQDLDTMNEIGAKSEELVRARNEMRAKVDKEFHDYMALAKIVITSTKLEETQLAELNSTLLGLNGTVGETDDESTLNNLHSTLTVVKNMEEQVAIRGEQTKQQLAKAFALANSLLKDTRRLLNVDDALINYLQSQLEATEKTRNIILTTSSRLKERAHILYVYPGGGFMSIFGLISDSTDLFINMEALDGSYAEPDMIEAKDRHIIYSDELKTTDPDIIIRRGEKVEIRLTRNETEADRIIALLDYMSSFYSQVHIVMKVVDNGSVIEFSEMVEALKKNVAKVIHWTCPDDNIMLLINKYNTDSLGYTNILIRKIVFNKFILKYHGDKIATFRVTANLHTNTYDIRVPFMPDLSNNTVPPKEHLAKLKTIKESL